MSAHARQHPATVRSNSHACCAGKCFLRQSIGRDTGTGICKKMLAALTVLQKNFCVGCARKYFLVQNSMRHSGNIETETLAAMLVLDQDAPIRTVGCVLAATT
eukprot:5757713-Karenia_brevis.AAC.1